MHFKFTVIGAGVIGLAVAKALSQKYARPQDLIVLEKERSFGQGISSRNSEVIHSGIYYPNKSLKHLLCIKGRRMLYGYLSSKNIPFNKCGKLIIAKDDPEIQELDSLYEKAKLNGVEGVKKISKQEALKLEPGINVVEALFSAETGIVDTHKLMASFERDVQDREGIISYGSEVASIDLKDAKYNITLRDGTDLTSEYVVNCAGLYATQIASLLGLSPVKMYPCKGVYFSYGEKHTCTHLVYPVPHKDLTGLGTHATIDMAGRLKFGPDVEYIDSITDNTIDPSKQEYFYLSAKEIFPRIAREKLAPDQAGIRPKIQGPNDGVKDFYIKDEKDSGYSGFIDLLGIESPGLTGALAIAEMVVGLTE